MWNNRGDHAFVDEFRRELDGGVRVLDRVRTGVWPGHVDKWSLSI
jgi:hypothetical protein